MQTSYEKIIDQAVRSPEVAFIENLSSSNNTRPHWHMKNLFGKKMIMLMKVFRPLVQKLIEANCSHLIFGSEEGDALLDPRLPKRLRHLKTIKSVQPKISVYTNLLKLDHFTDEDIVILLDSINTIYIDLSPRGFIYKNFYTAGYFKIAIRNLKRLLKMRSSVNVSTKFQVIHRKDDYYGDKTGIKMITGLLDVDYPMDGVGVPFAWGNKRQSEKLPLSEMAVRESKEAIYPCWYIRNPYFNVEGNLQLCSCSGHNSRTGNCNFETTVSENLLNVRERRQILADFLTGSVPQNCRNCSCYTPDHFFNLDVEKCTSLALAPEPTPLTFTDYTFPRKSHFKILEKYGPELYSKSVDPENCSVKVYQNLLVLAFLKNNIPTGARILEVGGGNSLILSKIHNRYECWNVDKFEGLGQGPKEIKEAPYKNVYAYMGDFSAELPPLYFDFVFSISALEHVEPYKKDLNERIFDDINRVLRPGGYSLHSLDVIADAMLERSYYDYIYHYLSLAESVSQSWAERFKIERNMWENREVYIPEIVYTFFNEIGVVNAMPAKEELSFLIDVWTMSEQVFINNWYPVVKRPYLEVGRPTAINILWQKLGKV